MVGESRFGGITRGGFLGLMLVGGLVVGLFFIPELLQLKSKKSSESATTAQSTQSSNNEVLDSEPALARLLEEGSNNTRSSRVVARSSDGSGNDLRVSEPVTEKASTAAMGWWNDIKSWFDSLSAPKLSKPSKDSARYAAAGAVDGRASLGMVSQRLDGQRGGQITWDVIRSTESRDAVLQARRDTLELARGLPSSATAARFAMIDFANGLEFVITRGEQQMTPRDAINYLAKLDQTVARSLAEDKVERVFVKRWSQISMGPVLGRTVIGQRHDTLIGSFDPQLTLTAIEVRHTRIRKGDPRTGDVKVAVSGYMIGDDIKRAFLEANEGGVLRRVVLKRDPRGYWFFNRGSLNGRYRWTFKVYDKFGERYQKTYEFFPRVQSFHKEGQLYKIPFRMTRGTVGLFRSQDYDPKLDRYFMTASQRDQGGEGDQNFVSF